MTGEELKKDGSVQIFIAEDEIKDGQFVSKIPVTGKVEGFVSSSDYRMLCRECVINNGEITISYTFDASGMAVGERKQGEIAAVTDAGEFFYPYEVIVEEYHYDSSMGEIKNLFHFTNLARSHWDEAVSLFTDKAFESILRGSAKRFLDVRDALLFNAKEDADKNRALESFLVYIRKKEPVKLSVRQSEFVLSDKHADSIVLEIEKNGWGYERIRLFDAGEGIGFERDDFDTISFTSDVINVGVSIDRIRFASFGNRGEFKVALGEREIKIKIDASPTANKKEKENVPSDERHVMIDVLRSYLDYRTGHMSLKECSSLAEAKLNLIRGTDTLLPTLYEVHLRLLKNDTGSANRLLSHVKNLLKKEDAGDDIYGYYLYLVAMSGNEDSERAKSLLDSYRQGKPGVFSYYWGYIHSSNAVKENPGRVYRQLKELWKRGVDSPVLYLEAALIVLGMPALYETMEEFELRLLFFMERYQLISEDFVPQVFEAAASLRRYSPLLISILKKYPAENEKQMLKVFCTQFLRGNSCGKEAVGYLKRGIEADCRINGLYEAYVRALDFDEDAVFPREAVHYFSYGSSLDDAHKAYVYHMLLKQNEVLSDKQTEAIGNFVTSELKKGHISFSLASLYLKMLEPEDMSDELKSSLIGLAFSRELTIKKKDIRPEWVYVRHDGMNKAGRYPVKGEKAVVYIYSEDYTITTEDKNGKVDILSGEDYDIRPYFDEDKLMVLIKGGELSGFEQAFYLCMKRPVDRAKNREEFEQRAGIGRWILKRDELNDTKKYEIAAALLKGYDKYGIEEEREAFLNEVPVDLFKGSDGELFVRELLSRGMYKKAYEAAMYSGFDRLDGKMLLRICQYALSEGDCEYDEKLLKLTYYVFGKSKYTTDMLNYLVEYYRGPVKQMRDVWKRAASMEVETEKIAERILLQMMRTRSYTADRAKIFKDYVSSGGRNELIISYLTDMAYAYLSNEEYVEEEFFDEARELIKNETDEIPVDIVLAMLKKACVDGVKDDEEKELIRVSAEEALKEGYYFPYYRAIEDMVPALRLPGEKTYVEYRDEPGMRIYLRYLTQADEEDGDDRGYKEEIMEEMYPGVYLKGFKIMYGESILYYLMEGKGENERMLTSGRLELSDELSDGGLSRFHLMNDMAIAKEMGDNKTVSELESRLKRLDALTKDNLKIR